MRNLHNVACSVVPNDIATIKVYIRRSWIIHSTTPGQMPGIPRRDRPSRLSDGLLNTCYCPTPYHHLLPNFCPNIHGSTLGEGPIV